ncbi:uncharacterized protein LOC111699847 isoform X2 [Eurytemora carolleeae]|uniref:uncharacterized protein LOC111699847 isoform X2 n=1 Tax=Eurytemora carolleeae TaxID=1294199 RepID=UPI000C773DDB|nr:uncharacterized protein LOC111699847 isoform X2 [Eurytemora carolleeae]|eukprot:XP_023326358.1 uncharacterized protein LOC111699847 isoform X2 [Eurytemora affinis]
MIRRRKLCFLLLVIHSVGLFWLYSSYLKSYTITSSSQCFNTMSPEVRSLLYHLHEEEQEYLLNKDAIEKEHEISCSSSTVDVALMMPFLDRYPTTAATYIPVLEWITIYSSKKIIFHASTFLRSRYKSPKKNNN